MAPCSFISSEISWATHTHTHSLEYSTVEDNNCDRTTGLMNVHFKFHWHHGLGLTHFENVIVQPIGSFIHALKQTFQKTQGSYKDCKFWKMRNFIIENCYVSVLGIWWISGVAISCVDDNHDIKKLNIVFMLMIHTWWYYLNDPAKMFGLVHHLLLSPSGYLFACNWVVDCNYSLPTLSFTDN